VCRREARPCRTLHGAGTSSSRQRRDGCDPAGGLRADAPLDQMATRPRPGRAAAQASLARAPRLARRQTTQEAPPLPLNDAYEPIHRPHPSTHSSKEEDRRGGPRTVRTENHSSRRTSTLHLAAGARSSLVCKAAQAFRPGRAPGKAAVRRTRVLDSPLRRQQTSRAGPPARSSSRHAHSPATVQAGSIAAGRRSASGKSNTPASARSKM
jgi:hypothetical protein